MEDQRPQLTIVVLENRQMIATILSELLTGAGYATRLVSRLADAEDILPQCQPGMFLIDMGMIRPEMQQQWQQLQEQAAALGTPMLTFSCSPLPESEDVLILRSPGDFAMVVQWADSEWRKKQPYLGMLLIERGLASGEEVEVALRIQRELSRVGRSYQLGDLLVRLGILSAEDLAQVLDTDSDRE
jgi:CheY-like chemotaxis protein